MGECAGACLRACSLINDACNTPPCHLRSLWLRNIFRHYLINCTIFEKKNLLCMKCVFRSSLQLLFETFLILGIIQRNIVINVKTSARKVAYSLFSSDFNKTWTFSTDFRKRLRYQISWKSGQSERRAVPCGRTDRQTDMTKLVVACHNFANAPNKCMVSC